MPLLKTIVSAAALGVVLGALLGSTLFTGFEVHASKETVGVLDAELWDPQTGRWSPAGALTEGRVTPDLVPVGDEGVLVVGGTSDKMPALMTLAWSPVMRTFKDAWSPEIALGCRAALPLPDGRVLFSSASEIDNWGIAVNHAELWDSPSLGVRAAAPLAGGRVLFVFASGAAVWNEQTLAWEGVPEAVPGTNPLDCGDSARALTLASGRVLVVSRFFRAGAEAWAWLWDPATGVLARAAALEQALTAADPTHLAEESVLAALTLSPTGRVVVLGDRAAYLADQGLTSATAVALPADREGAATAIVGGRLLVAGGGRDGSASAGAATVDLDSAAVARTGAMTAARTEASALALPDGRVLVVGGSAQQWHISWGRFVVLAVLIFAAVGALVALGALAKRSGRRWVVVGFALVPCALVAGGAILMLLVAMGSALRG
jgi:hypothetical protein